MVQEIFPQNLVLLHLKRCLSKINIDVFFFHYKTLDFITVLQLLPDYFVKLVSSKKNTRY